MDNEEKRYGKKSARKSGGVGVSYDADFRGFINPVITDEQKDAFERWSASASPWEALEAGTRDGIVFSVKWDARSQGFMGSATQRRSDSPNAGLAVTARASDAGKALFRVLFCVVVLNHATRWEDAAPIADPDRW